MFTRKPSTIVLDLTSMSAEKAVKKFNKLFAHGYTSQGIDHVTKTWTLAR